MLVCHSFVRIHKSRGGVYHGGHWPYLLQHTGHRHNPGNSCPETIKKHTTGSTRQKQKNVQSINKDTVIAETSRSFWHFWFGDDKGCTGKSGFRIWDVYPGFRFRIFSSQIPDPGSKRFRFLDQHKRIFNPKINFKLSEIWSGMLIPDSDPGPDLEIYTSGIQDLGSRG